MNPPTFIQEGIKFAINVIDMEQLFNSTDQQELNSQAKQERICFLSDLIKNKQADTRILEWAGFLALENKQWLMAENIFSSLLERRNKAFDFVGLAKALRKQSRWDEAKECYLAALDKITEPCSLLFIVYKALGDIYLLKSDFPMAEEYYNKASTLNPSCASLIFHRAVMHLKEKNYIEAEKYFQIFIQSHSCSAKAWLGLALTRKALGDEELALACLNRSLDIKPQNPRSLNLKRQWRPALSERFSSSLSFSA